MIVLLCINSPPADACLLDILSSILIERDTPGFAYLYLPLPSSDNDEGACIPGEGRHHMINANTMPMPIHYDDKQIPSEAVHDDIDAICYLRFSVLVLLGEAGL